MRKLDQSNKRQQEETKEKNWIENISQDNMSIFKYISNIKCEWVKFPY